MAESQITIKVGELQFEASGEAKWVADQVREFWENLEQIKAAGVSADAKENDLAESRGSTADNKRLTTSQIATKLGCKRGPDLIIAAAAHLGLVKGKLQFTRTELIDEMKSATAFFNKNYVSNLSSYLKKIVQDDDLNEVGTQTYALSADKAENLRNSLGL
jgi:hypothetical protein